jgi:ADP-heptose:LPS heptosyltransferase
MKLFGALYDWVGLSSAKKGTLLRFIHSLLKLPLLIVVRLYRFLFKESTLLGPELAVAVLLRGSLGDHIISARFLRDFAAAVPGVPIDIFSDKEGIVSYLFSDCPYIRSFRAQTNNWSKLKSNYVLSITLSQFIEVVSFEGREFALRWADKQTQLMAIIRNISEFDAKFSSYILDQPFLDGAAAHTLGFWGYNRYSLHTYAKIKNNGNFLDLAVEPIVDFAPKGHSGYITVNTGFDENFGHFSTKAYPHMAKVIDAIRAQFPSVQVIQVGSATSERIENADMDYRGKTSLPQCAFILRESLLHIDTEGGLVHMAASLGTKSCVLFGPTPVSFFGYEDNINIGPAACGGCYWSTKTWMANCPRGFKNPICMHETKPETVAEAIFSYLTSRGIERADHVSSFRS